MFKKLKDKLAEEVKSSPQRIQQFAQAAQAAVTSASSSISDITNSDLFSIGDNDSQQTRTNKASSSSQSSQQNTFQDVALVQPIQPNDSYDLGSTQDIIDNQRQRRLSNSSFASDVSFRLPSYETPSMYHLQSDIEVSASEAEERGFSSSNVSLDRVTKEQLYAAYRRTQERYTKYRTQYGDLARHYKLLERENAKARAHLEKALRLEIEEKCMKIEALNTKVQLLQSNSDISSHNDKNDTKNQSSEGDVQLINLSNDIETYRTNEESSAAEIGILNNKIEKMEQLLNKYKESLKSSKEKNSQINTELQILSNELENKNKEIEQLKFATEQLRESKQKINELNNLNEELQNKINVYEFNKTREQSTLEIDFQKAQQEIMDLRGKIEIFSKREEEYAISLAENKLSIHKELESKETEIKSLKDHLEASKKEILSLNIVINDYKNNMTLLETERSKLSYETSELALNKSKISELELKIEELTKRCQNLEQIKMKADEGYRCLQLQMKQETAEKLAMIDRNTYLENRNTQLTEENAKKSTQIGHLEIELHKKDKALEEHALEDTKKDELLDELNIWKDKYEKLESEIQEERDELIKLQSEIEKLLVNHELLQTQNIESRKLITDLKLENAILHEKLVTHNKLKTFCLRLSNDIRDMKRLIHLITSEAKSLQTINNEAFFALTKEINYALNNISYSESNFNTLNELKSENNILQKEIKTNTEKYETLITVVNVLRDENNNLKLTINECELEKTLIREQVKQITDRYEAAINELNCVKDENANLLRKIDELENNSQNLQIAMELEKKQYLGSIEMLKLLNIEIQTLTATCNRLENENGVFNKELDVVKNLHSNTLKQLEVLRNENLNLLGQSKELDNKIGLINELRGDNKNLTHENNTLKSQVKSISESYKNLEFEIKNLRKSHADIEAEKAHLNVVIEKFASKNTQNKDSQTEDTKEQLVSVDNLDIDRDTSPNKNKLTELVAIDVQQSIDRDEELSIKYNSLKTDYDVLKEENRRFKSDIEGLQTYLTKISKENSVLNDKLRELIATSEHSADSNDIDLSELNKELQSRKEKIDDLLRENMFLVEENLELKDQLQSQNYPKPEINTIKDNEKDYTEKYNNLLQDKSTLERRLNDLEQMNKSVNGNMLQMQEKNEKLRLSNEKLERRLDEALVSLRHLHSLQENTELEYLRNILYEYLTGSGIHSVTLAKVLSAIVKFDDMQTQLVLQKEKERQGFLRQLGII